MSIDANTQLPELSVVIPTVGRETLIPTVKSLLAADGADRMEVIVAGAVGDGPVGAELRELCAAHSAIRHLPVQFEKGDSSEKKNAGWRAASADYVAFLDDDVEVASDWPVRVLEAFAQPSTTYISGPGLVPPRVDLFARLAGIVLASPATGYVAWRYRHGASALVPVKWSKIIGCNMAFRRALLEEMNGFDPGFWPGEEMIAAYQAEQRGHQLKFYSPAWVYHYPRQSLVRFCRQIIGYGSTRIRLLRAGVEFEPTTLIPAAGVFALVMGLIGACFSRVLAVGLLGAMALYALAALGIGIWMALESRQSRDLLCALLVPVVHVCYGIAGWWEIIRPNHDFSISRRE